MPAAPAAAATPAMSPQQSRHTSAVAELGVVRCLATLMRPMLSEFSYGYALTEQLTQTGTGTLIAAPLFPSLIEEGQPNVGFDVHIPYPVTPLFLQFKLSHRLERRSAGEYALLGGGYYRMHLRPSRFSSQHNALLNLESRGEQVFYAAPLFHRMEQLSAAYLARSVVERSAFFPPSAIGALPDHYDHHVSFTATQAYFCSEPKRIDYDFKGITQLDRFQRLARHAETKADKKFFLHLLDHMADALSETGRLPEQLHQLRDGAFRERVTRREVTHLAAFTARSSFDAEIILLAHKPNDKSTGT